MKKKQTVFILTALYMLFVLYVLLGRRPWWPSNPILYWDYIKRNIQLVPLRTISEMLTLAMEPSTYPRVRYMAALNLIGNTGLLVPGGFLFPLVIKPFRKAKVFIPCMILGIVLLETVQLFAAVGSFDVDDILLNFSGCLLGYAVYRRLSA